ncbi:MAG TPA: APC family permease [Capillimicrobium sp.]|jgi:amino acid transporter
MEAASAPPPAAAGGEKSPLKQAITGKLLFFFILGDMLGAGIYALVGEVGAEVGGAIWTAFLLALLLAVFTAFAYAELVTKFPQAAGAALYVNKAFRLPFLTFLVAFAVMCSGLTSAATLSTAFAGDYLKEFIDVPTTLAAIVFLLGVSLLNARGISESVRVNMVLTTIEIGGLLLICIIALGAIGDSSPGVDTARAFEFKEGEAASLAVLSGAALAFYALIGFEDSVNVAEETRDPRRVFPRALFAALAVGGVVYLAVTMLASMAVPTEKLSGSSGPLLEVAAVGPLSVDPKIFSAIALFAIANGALLNLIMASRLTFGMSREGIVPGVFAKVLPSWRTPVAAIVFTAALCGLLIIIGDLESLADTTVTLLLCVFILVNVSALWLKRTPVEREHFRAPWIFPVLGVVVCAVLLARQSADTFLFAGGLMVLGVVLYAISRAITGPAPIDTQKLERVSKQDP